MKKKLSPTRWAIDLSVVLNAIPDFNRFPVNVTEVAKEISRLKFPDDPITLIKGRDLPGFEGAMKRAPEGKVGWGIFYNSGIRSKGRINFTLAHEFGHYLVHRIDHPNGFMCSTADMAKWDSQYSQLEAQANEFAANFLMPLDDFRDQIDPKALPDMGALSECAERYEVSLIAGMLRWLSYTSRRAMLVVSREGFVLWARSSTRAYKSGIYIKTQGRPPTEIPSSALASRRNLIDGYSGSIEHDSKVWFKQPCREQVIFSDQYDFTISLLFFEDEASYSKYDEEPDEEDTCDRFSRRNSGHGWC